MIEAYGGDIIKTGRRAFVALAAFCFFTCPGTAFAGTYSAVVENDVFSGTDEDYTSGLRLGYVSSERRGAKIARALLRAGPDARTRMGYALGQSIYTPSDISIAAPLPDQHPYGGWLYGEVSVFVDRGKTLDVLTLDLGVVGPHAFGEEVQNSFHRLIRGAEAQGWANQLRDEPGLMLSFDRIWRLAAVESPDGFGFDIAPQAGFTVGNVLTQAKAGVKIRIGERLTQDLGPARIRPSAASGGYFERADGVIWYLFAGVEARGIARNIFLDGNTFRDSLSVERLPFGAEAQGGVVIQIDRIQAAYTYVWRRREFETQDDAQKFGVLSLSVFF